MNEKTRQLLQNYLPMSEQSLLVLLSLTEPRHGYAIMQSVQAQTKGRVAIGPSTVYTILYKMEQDGLIDVVSEDDRRKVYLISDVGYEVLNAEASRLSNLARYASFVLSGKETVKAAEVVSES